MDLHPPGCGQLVVQGVPDENVAEANTAGRPGHIVEYALRHGLVQDVHQLIGPELAELGKSIQAELPAHDRGRHEQRPARRGEPRHTPTDHGAHPRWDSQMGARPAHVALRGQQLHDLGHEEGVPLRLGMDRLDKARCRLDPGRELHVLRHVRRGQAGERDLGRVQLAHELGQRRVQRLSQRRIDIAISTDDE